MSSPCCREIIESSDCYIVAGPIFNDYSTSGYTTQLKDKKMIKVGENRVTVCGGQTFGCVNMKDFLNALAKVRLYLSIYLYIYIYLDGEEGRRKQVCYSPSFPPLFCVHPSLSPYTLILLPYTPSIIYS